MLANNERIRAQYDVVATFVRTVLDRGIQGAIQRDEEKAKEKEKKED